MARNRIIHNVQDVFIGSTPDESDSLITGIQDHQVIKRVSRAQSFNYSISTTKDDAMALGKTTPFSRKNNQPATVNLSLSYLFNGVDNERRAGLNVGSIEDRIYTSDFSAGVPSNDGWGTASANFDYPESIGGKDDAAKITATSASAYHRAYRDVGTVAGKKYKVTASVWIPSIGTNVAGFQFRYANGVSTPIIHPTVDAWYDFSYEYIAGNNNAYDGWIEFWMANSSTVDTTSTFDWAGASNDYMYIKNIVVTEVKCLTHDMITSQTKDKRNLYLAINEKDLNIQNDQDTPTFDNTLINLIDGSSTGYGLIAFQNCHLTNYQINIAPQQTPSIELSYVADNMVGYTSGSGIGIPLVSASDASVTQSGTKIVIPKSYKESDSYTGNFLSNYSYADVTITSDGTNVIDEFLNDHIVSCNISTSIERDSISYVGHKLFSERKPKIPATASLSLETLVKENVSGSFLDNMKEGENYNLVIDLKDNLNATLAKYKFSGAKLDSISYNSQVLQNKTASLSFTNYMDFGDEKSQGLFVEGKITSAKYNSELYYPQF